MAPPRVLAPPRRQLRAYALDPQFNMRFDAHDMNDILIDLPWDPSVGPGPVDEYLEVVDYDPASRVYYPPVDLNHPYILAQDGLPPQDHNPQFHQQMVYAVARATIGHFEQALGRSILWSVNEKKEYVDKLRIHPHALREANAFYSPAKKALLFGYFPADKATPGSMLPGEMIFTCLSHDIIAHETTHAIIDGLHPRFVEPMNGDVLALHEAIADLVALFQHFTYPKVLRTTIARTRGNLEQENLLAQLAVQFGQANGMFSALRDAIGTIKDDKWVRHQPDPSELAAKTEVHDRGAIFVAAVFDAFLTVYQARCAPLLRVATEGRGVLPSGDLHPDLVDLLTEEAAKTARHFLHIVIRALDYCPPVDADFGDFLRALITADVNVVARDPYDYRRALIEAFCRRGIYPRDVSHLSENNLLWHVPDDQEQDAFTAVFKVKTGDILKPRKIEVDWGLSLDRETIFNRTQDSAAMLHCWIHKAHNSGVVIPHLVLDKAAPPSVYRSDDGLPSVEVHALRPAHRITPDGEMVTELFIEITQRRRGYLDPKIQQDVDGGKIAPPQPDFIFRGGCTLIVDPRTGDVRYSIYKNLLSNERLQRMREFLGGPPTPSLRANYFGDVRQAFFTERNITDRNEGKQYEPFALLYRSMSESEVK